MAFESNRDGYSAIYTVDNQGLGLLQITPSAAYEGHPDWSPDGEQIAYESTATGLSEIYVIAADGSGEPFQVTTSGGFWPAWSSDGTQIFYGNFGSSSANLWVVDVDW